MGFGGMLCTGALEVVIGASAEGGIRQESTEHGPRHDAKKKRKKHWPLTRLLTVQPCLGLGTLGSFLLFLLKQKGRCCY